MSQPDVSVLMAARDPLTNYPPGQFERAIASMFEQSDVTVQLCIVDDASNDRDYFNAVVSGRGDIKAGGFIENSGPAAAYQFAAQMATGRYIILQSVRSWYEPGAFRAMIDVLDSRPDVGFVYGKTQYHGVREDTYTPPPFVRDRFWQSFDSLFGYMYRREALDAGCTYDTYLHRDGRHIDIADYDFMMQLLVKMEWSGLALRDRTVLHYLYSGEGQQTNLVHQYQSEIDAEFRRRWGVSA